MTDSILIGITKDGERVELCRWMTENGQYDASGWLDHFGHRVGTGTARLPDGGWIDLSAFCIVRGGEVAD